jgi:hypothetical protein
MASRSTSENSKFHNEVQELTTQVSYLFQGLDFITGLQLNDFWLHKLYKKESLFVRKWLNKDAFVTRFFVRPAIPGFI